ncbi:MAG: hypothetical protein AAFO07_08340, partial [Bacteroidota bacterium]
FDQIKFTLDYFLRFVPVTFLSIYMILRKDTPALDRTVGAIWMPLVLLAILLPGKEFSHYFIQMMVPTSILAGAFWDTPIGKRPKWLRAITSSRIGIPLLGLFLGIIVYFMKVDYLDKPDYPKEIASYLKENMEDGEQVYVGNFGQVIYFLLDQQSPIPYVHSSLVWKESHQYALMIDKYEVCDQIKFTQPDYIVREYESKDQALPLEDWIQANYLPVKSWHEDRILLYQKK